tara:strand:- start:2163 stop:2414 length:252 start_codon:yes stop_codon:yes gene_type:complete
MEIKLSLRKKPKKRPGEIRGLLAGMYSSDGMLLDVFRDDDGIHIVHVDFDLDMLSHWVIDEKGNLIAQSVETLDSCDDDQNAS